MNNLQHLRIKAIEFRKKGYSLNEICKRLNKRKSTVYYWIKNVEIERKNAFLKKCQINMRKSAIEASKYNRIKYKKIHEEYRLKAINLWENNLKFNNNFKLFLMLYSCEGDRKSKYYIRLSNSDTTLLIFCHNWFKKLNINNKIFEYNIQLHVDQNEKEIIAFWKSTLSINEIKVRRKSNTGKMFKRNWNSKYGVLSISFCDSYLKTMIDTWISLLKEKLNNFEIEFKWD